MSTTTPEILSRSTAPGASRSAYTPTRHRVSTTRGAGDHPEAEPLRILADRVSDCVRRQAESLLAAGILSYREARDLIWKVEHAAGATTHVMPGYGPCESSYLDSGGMVHLAERLGVPGIIPAHRRSDVDDMYVLTSRGIISHVSSSDPAPEDPPQWQAKSDAAMAERLSILTAEDRERITTTRDRLNAILSTQQP
jgi:hypothetical protein